MPELTFSSQRRLAVTVCGVAAALAAFLAGCMTEPGKAPAKNGVGASQGQIMTQELKDELKAIHKKLEVFRTWPAGKKLTSDNKSVLVEMARSDLPGVAASALLRMEILQSQKLLTRADVLNGYQSSLEVVRGANAFLVVLSLISATRAFEKPQGPKVGGLLALCQKHDEEPQFATDERRIIETMVNAKGRDEQVYCMLLLMSKSDRRDAEFVEQTFAKAKKNAKSQPSEYWAVLEAALRGRISDSQEDPAHRVENQLEVAP